MEVRLASLDEAVEILSQDKVVERTGKKPGQIIYQPWMVEEGEAQMMFFFWEVENGLYEVHIATMLTRTNIRKSREFCRKVVSWVFEHGAEEIVTNAPEGQISNLARKIGLDELYTIDKTVHFSMRSEKWALVQL